MITYKEFYIWLEGYLHNKLENKKIEILPIVEKMQQVGDKTMADIMDRRKNEFHNLPINVEPKLIRNDDKENSTL
jgi:hypothetical protein